MYYKKIKLEQSSLEILMPLEVSTHGKQFLQKSAPEQAREKISFVSNPQGKLLIFKLSKNN